MAVRTIFVRAPGAYVLIRDDRRRWFAVDHAVRGALPPPAGVAAEPSIVDETGVPLHAGADRAVPIARVARTAGGDAYAFYAEDGTAALTMTPTEYASFLFAVGRTR